VQTYNTVLGALQSPREEVRGSLKLEPF